MFILSISCFAPVEAAEIGNIRVLSYIGQALKAEIELTAVTPEEAQSLQVKLALPDVYRLANIRRNSVLNNVRLQLRQQEQRFVVVMYSNQAILDSYLNIYLEFNDTKGHEVRALTLWLEADPNHPLPENTSNREELPHPDGDLAETAAPLAQASSPPPSPAATPLANTAQNIVANADTVMPRSRIYAPQPSLATPPPRSTIAPAAIGNQCAGQVHKLQQQAQRCQLLRVENERISDHLGILESKVDVLKRVILAEEAASAVASKPNAVAAITPTPSKKTQPSAAAIPWKILAISAAVFVGVAILAFMLLTLRSKRLAQKKRKPIAKPTDTATPEGSTKDETAATPDEQLADGDAANTSPPPKLSKFAAFRQRLKTLGKGKATEKAKPKKEDKPDAQQAGLRAKLAKPFVALSEKTRLGWQTIRAKLTKKKAKTEKTEPVAEKPA